MNQDQETKVQNNRKFKGGKNILYTEKLGIPKKNISIIETTKWTGSMIFCDKLYIRTENFEGQFLRRQTPSKTKIFKKIKMLVLSSPVGP